MRVLIIAPTNFQSYATTILVKLIEDPNIEVVGVLIHKFTFRRIKNEFKRDGKRIFTKVFNKAILSEKKSLNYSFQTPKKILENFGIKADLKEICKEHNLYFKEVSLFNSSKLSKELSELKLDIGAFCGGGLLRDNFLNSFSFGVLNCHMGILPHYRGMDVVEWPFLENDKFNVGVTCHLMDKGIDTGDILEIVKVNPVKFHNFTELREYLSGVMYDLMLKNIASISLGDFEKSKQLESDGKQYFVMHPLLKKIAIKKYN
jgi:methionyl-tRNA formyltransferase